ncbi:MAG: 5-(carboxyamino)imidazole ribonucleotide mutase [Gammaproteobacteria bacterium]
MKVGIFMGSKSDLEIVSSALNVLEEFGVDYEYNILSAHRTPSQVINKITELEGKGVEVFIGAAGMAAHLSGVIAAHTHKPVLGIPLDGGTMGGIDSLLSTVQMPKGVPVATFAIGKAGAINAAIFAIQILSSSDKELAKRFDEYRKKMTNDIIEINNSK